MSETPKVEIVSEHRPSDPPWGKGSDYKSSERFKLSMNSVFWILAPLFVILPWVIYMRNSEQAKRTASEFSFKGEEPKSKIPILEVPEISNRSPESKPKAIEVVRKFSSLQVIGLSLKPIPPGAQVKAVLVMGASNGPVKAKTTERLVVDGDVLLDAGVTLIGRAQSGEDRLFIIFNKVVWPDGTNKPMTAQGYDVSDMIPGLKGARVRSQVLKFAAAASLNFLGGLSEGLQESQVAGGVAVRKNDLRNAALNGASKAALDQGKSLLESARDDQNVIEVKANTALWVVFGGEN